MIDLAQLRSAVAAHGRVARVVIAAHDGSSPREAGAAMLVWQDSAAGGGQSGTIGGGALEWQALGEARAHLTEYGPEGQGQRGHLRRVPLGPALGQCCGGAVTLVTEIFTETTLPQPEAGVFARRVDGGTPDLGMPLAVRRVLDRARAQGVLPAPALLQGWLVEPVALPQREIWVWGAGHVGRAVVAVLAPLPGLQIRWIDVAEDRFPPQPPAGVIALPCADPARLVAHAPLDAEHLILTYSHALDLDLCHRLLQHGFARCGLIGSATKWARFRSKLAALGHAPQQVARIACPIGAPALGKHPQAIAIGVAMAVLQQTVTLDRQEAAR